MIIKTDTKMFIWLYAFFHSTIIWNNFLSFYALLLTSLALSYKINYISFLQVTHSFHHKFHSNHLIQATKKKKKENTNWDNIRHKNIYIFLYWLYLIYPDPYMKTYSIYSTHNIFFFLSKFLSISLFIFCKVCVEKFHHILLYFPVFIFCMQKKYIYHVILKFIALNVFPIYKKWKILQKKVNILCLKAMHWINRKIIKYIYKNWKCLIHNFQWMENEKFFFYEYLLQEIK